MMNDELITLYFNYLITDFGFHVQKRLFDYSVMGNAFVVFESSSVGIEIVIDRDAVSISIGDRSDEKQEWVEFAFVLKHYASTLERVYVIPEKTSDNTWEDVIKYQLDRLAKILREYCEPLLKGDLSAMESIKKTQREEVAKMKAQWSKAAGHNKQGN
ncbi:MAG: hypothetical protein WBW94_06280 [Anaerolineales bacterium]